MITWRTGTVTARGKAWGDGATGARELDVVLDTALPSHDDSDPGRGDDSDDRTVRALAYTGLVGDPRVGDQLLLNCSALARRLGTGGYALVVGPSGALPPDPEPGPGHLVKARYTPLQAMVLGVDEQESPHHQILVDADTLDGMPVVVADLHSALPAIIAGARHAAARAGRPAPRIAYVMTDGAALPAPFSHTIATLRDTGWLTTTITVGQAFGGDLEAVTTHTGLLAAHHIVHADLTVVTQGPGNLGTGTRWGYSGVAAGETVNATHTLGGQAVASLRVSGADPRDRHLGISHHSLTAYGRVALTPAVKPRPSNRSTESSPSPPTASSSRRSRPVPRGSRPWDGASRTTPQRSPPPPSRAFTRSPWSLADSSAHDDATNPPCPRLWTGGTARRARSLGCRPCCVDSTL